MAFYRLGELNQRVTLESKARTRDGVGGASVAWSSYATVSALVRPLSGREREHAGRREATADYLVVIRNRTDLVEAHRIGWAGRKLNIVFIRSRGSRTQFLEVEVVLGGSS